MEMEKFGPCQVAQLIAANIKCEHHNEQTYCWPEQQSSHRDVEQRHVPARAAEGGGGDWNEMGSRIPASHRLIGLLVLIYTRKGRGCDKRLCRRGPTRRLRLFARDFGLRKRFLGAGEVAEVQNSVAFAVASAAAGWSCVSGVFNQGAII